MQVAEKVRASLPGSLAMALMEELSNWGNTTTIILQGGCVFEFKGVFPGGEIAEGYYNLKSNGQGFEGHIKLEVIERVTFQSREHRGQESHAFVFEDKKGDAIFKVFLGRDETGELITEQVSAFNEIKTGWIGR